MTKTKKFLASLLSLSLLIPVKSSVYAVKEKNLSLQQQTASNTSANSFVFKIIFSVFISLFSVNSGKEVYNELEYKKNVYNLSENFSKRYANELTSCKITKKQEGKMWCWLACLQGLLKYNGINKSQKEIFKGISNSMFVPFLECNRNTGLSIYNSEQNMKNIEKTNHDSNNGSIIFPNMMKKYVEEISNGKLTYQIAYIKPHSSDRNIKRSIYDVYKKIGKKPFSILANHTSSGHFVNVFKIDNRGIMYIEDPAFEKGRKESIDEYVKYFDTDIKSMMDNANGIMIGFVTEKSKALENPWFWSGRYKISDKI